VEIYNVDKLVPEDRTLVLGGRELVVPGSLPVRFMLDVLRCSKAVQNDPTDADAVKKSIDVLYGIFSIRTKGLDREWFDDNLSLSTYEAIIGWLFSGVKKAEVEEKKTQNGDATPSGI
jgi:hypothetical protein